MLLSSGPVSSGHVLPFVLLLLNKICTYGLTNISVNTSVPYQTDSVDQIKTPTDKNFKVCRIKVEMTLQNSSKEETNS